MCNFLISSLTWMLCWVDSGEKKINLDDICYYYQQSQQLKTNALYVQWRFISSEDVTTTVPQLLNSTKAHTKALHFKVFWYILNCCWYLLIESASASCLTIQFGPYGQDACVNCITIHYGQDACVNCMTTYFDPYSQDSWVICITIPYILLWIWKPSAHRQSESLSLVISISMCLQLESLLLSNGNYMCALRVIF